MCVDGVGGGGVGGGGGLSNVSVCIYPKKCCKHSAVLKLLFTVFTL